MKSAQELKGIDLNYKLYLGNADHHNLFSGFRNFDPPFTRGIDLYMEELKTLMMQLTLWEDPRVQTVMTGLKEFVLFNWSRGNLRKAWRPQSGKGSQENSTGIHKALAKTILAICRKEDKELAELYAEDGDHYTSHWKQHNREEKAKRAAKKNEQKGKQVSSKKTR